MLVGWNFISWTFAWRVAVPAIVSLKLRHALAGDGVGDDDSWLAEDGSSCFKCVCNLFDIVSVYLNDVPVPSPPLI